MDSETAIEPSGDTIDKGATEDQIGSSSAPDADLIDEELLVEEISIDGMCGVY